MNIIPVNKNISANSQQAFKAKAPVIQTIGNDYLLEKIVNKHNGDILRFLKSYNMPTLKLARRFAPEELVRIPFYQDNYGAILINSGTKTTVFDLNKIDDATREIGYFMANEPNKVARELKKAIFENIRLNSEIPHKGLSVEV